MAGYARQSSSSIADGETITAAPLNSEFDAVLAAFAFSGGHNHDGSSTEGSYVSILADVDALNKIVVDNTNNRHGFFVQVSSSAVEQLRIQDGAIVPVTSNDIDLGTSSLQFKDIHIDGTAYVDTLEVHVGASLSAGVLALPDGSASAPVLTNSSDTNQGLFFSGTDEMSYTAGGTAQVTFADGVIKPVTDNDVDLGTSSLQFKDIHINGTANIDTLAGTTMSGNLAMGSNSITGLATPSADGDAARKVYVDNAITNASNLTQLGGNINVNGSHFFGSSGEDIKFKPVGSASILSTQDNDGEFVALVLRNESDAADTTGIASLRFDLEDTSGNTVDAAKIAVKKEASFTATAATQDSSIVLSTSLNGTLTEYIKLTSAGILEPITNNTVDIGTALKQIKNIFVDGTAYIDAIGFGTTSVALPGADGTANQILKTNGSGTIAWANDGGLPSTSEIGDLTAISSIASDDVLLAIDTTDGALKKVARSTLVAGLATSSALSNIVEDTTPQLGGNLDAQGKSVTDVGILGYSYGASGSPTVVAVTVASKTSGHPYNGDGSSSAYFLDGAEAPAINLNGVDSVTSSSGYYYKFDQAHSSNSGHPLRFYLDAAKSLAYTTGVTTSGTPGNAGAHTTIAVTDQTPSTLYYQCSSHAYMGNYASVDSAYIASSGAVTIDAVGDVTLDAGGGDIFFKDGGTTFGSATNASGNLILKSGTTTALTFAGANATIAGNLIVTGNHTVNGTTTTVNSATVTIDDPIFTLGGDSAPSSDDNKDRGIEFRYHTGSAAKVGFFGWDDNEGAFTFVPDATNSSEVFSGTVGNVIFGNITGTLQTAAQTNITSTGALGGGSIAAGFGAIDNGTSGIRTNTFTAETSVVPDESGGADLGSTSLEWGDLYIADDKKIYLGSDQNFSIEYDEDGNDTTAIVAANGVAFAPHGTGTGNGTELKFQELAANGANYVGFKAPDAISSNEVWVLPNADGSADQVLKTDGSNALAWVDQSGGGVVDRVADGAIAIRKPVILTAAGKAKQLAAPPAATATPSATPIAVGTGNLYDFSLAYEPTSEKFVVSYKDTANGNYPTIVAGSWNDADGTVAWGTSVVILSSGIVESPRIAAGNGRIHVVYGVGGYSSNGDHLQNLRTATIASNNTFSGFSTSVDTFGPNVGGSYSGSIKLAFDPTTNYLISTYTNKTDGTGNFYAIPIHISGTTYTTGTPITVTSGNPANYRTGIVFDPDTNRTVIAYKDNGNSGYTTANVIQSTGTAGSPTLSMGADAVVDNGDAGGTTVLSYDTANNKVFLTYENSADSELKGAIGTVTAGTNAISFTTPASIKNTTADYENFDQIYDSDNNKVYFLYKDRDDGNDLTYFVITPGASSFSVSSAAEISDIQYDFRSGGVAYAAGKGAVFGLSDTSNSYALNYITFQNRKASNLDGGNYLGISAAAISNGATGKINVIGGVSTGHSSLSTGNHYFSNGAGTVGLVGDAFGEQYLGKAISATEIQLLENEGYLYGTAEGAVTKGKSVVVEADGDFKLVGTTTQNSATPTTKFASVGQSNQSTNQSQPAMTYEATSGKYVMYYTNNQNSTYPTISIGTWSNGTITWGTAIVITSLSNDDQMPITSGDGRIYMLLQNTSFGSMQLAVGTISGTSFNQTFRNTIENGSACAGQKIAYSPTQNQVIMVYSRNNGGQKGYARTASISGTGALTATGSEVQMEVTNFHTDRGSLIYDPDTDRALYASFNGSQNDDGMAWVLQASGTASSPSVVVGTGTKWNGNANVGYTASCYDTKNNKIFLAFEDPAAGAVKGTVVTITAGTNSSSFGTAAAIWSDHAGDHFSVAYEEDGEKITFWYRDDDNSDRLTYKTVTPSATSFTVANGAVLKTSDCRLGPNSAASGGAGKGIAVAVSDTSTDPAGQIAYASAYYAEVSVTNLTAENYIGIATKDVANDGQVEVATFGQIDAQQSSLTAGQIYYTQTDGTLSTTAATPSSVAGRALSATKLLISSS